MSATPSSDEAARWTIASTRQRGGLGRHLAHPQPHEPGRHLEAALQTAVSIGDDTDTVAVIAGCLLGARWGASAIPTTWREALHGWPGLDADDLVELAKLTALNASGGGCVDGVRRAHQGHGVVRRRTRVASHAVAATAARAAMT